MDKRHSLLLVTVDCLRADHVGFMGYGRPTTPFLDCLAAESMVFPHAIVGGAPTYYSLPSVLASRHPLALGRDVIGIAPGEPTLASVLKEFGYETAAFVAANPYLSPSFGYEQGFDNFRDFLDADSPVTSSNGASGNGGLKFRNRINSSLRKISSQWRLAEAAYEELYFQYCQRMATPRSDSLDALRCFPAADVLVDQASAWLELVGRKPFFLWLHLMDPHSPYYPTENALARMGHSEVTPFRARYLNSYWNRSDLSAKRFNRHRENIVTLYDASIRWVDTQVARLVNTLIRFHQWRDCVFAFTADHGEEFLDHEGRYHPPSKLSEEIVRAPLLVRVPQQAKFELPSAPFSHLHLAPTLLDILKLPIPTEFEGHSVWHHLKEGSAWDEPAIVESVGNCTNPFHADARVGPRLLAVRETRYKLILDFDRPAEQLFDLEADPRERTPLPLDAEKRTGRRLLEHARRHLARPLHVQYPHLRLRARLRDLQIKSAKTVRQSVSACG